ncbi:MULTISPECIES: hypothetical protein [Eubacteriales]|uniref:Yip1 domain-containing protein n=1 Tax=Clostridium isatidis TaxID=182773 RepID=A0A343JE99_9CLOT|nr:MULTISPECIES: hypothetical protein [Eubacteriales]ASW43857.1 hypothetical protein BEN51_10280 [Clostridium isatidis]
MSKVKTMQKINKKEIETLNKYFDILKLILLVSPFISIMYLSLKATTIGLTISEAITNNPEFSIVFLVSMINPFIAYLLKVMHNKINNNDVEYAVVNLVLILLAELLLQNILFIALFVFILYKTLKVYKINIINSFKKKLTKGFLITISGSVFIIALASICSFAMMRINI